MAPSCREQFQVQAEAGVTMVDEGAQASANTLKDQTDVAGFAFGDKGLMADAWYLNLLSGATIRQEHGGTLC